MLEARGFDTETFTDGHDALAFLADNLATLDVMLCDVSMPGMDGLEVLGRVHQIAPNVPVVMLTGDRSADTAVRALKAGAFNYLTKPPADPDEVVAVLDRAASYGRLQRRALELERRVDVSDRFDRLVGSCGSMRTLFESIERVAGLDVSVVIRGESGTGKELVARSIHERSPRARGPFVALNCAAVPETLVDSELFGHARGAFTGAVEARAGAFERAHGGTLFLDEIGDIPHAVQVRLLRVLQEGEFTRLGEGNPRPMDVRVVAATWVDLEAAVEAGDFRPDLFYRLNVVNLEVPPLRNRREDLPLLIAHLTHKHAEKMRRATPELSPETVDALCSYHWPGNVRELENSIQRALALCPGPVLTPDALPPQITNAAAIQPLASGDDLSWCDDLPISEARRFAAERFERAYVQRLLRVTGGNISEAARRANIDRSNLRKIIARVGVEPGDYKD